MQQNCLDSLIADADDSTLNMLEDRVRCEVWTRVMGYHRPVSFWNVGKQSEHRERKYFKAVNETT